MTNTVQLSEKAAAFMAKGPAVLGRIGDRVYYEHPDMGDEVPMYYIEYGKLRRSVHWDMESAGDGE